MVIDLSFHSFDTMAWVLSSKKNCCPLLIILRVLRTRFDAPTLLFLEAAMKVPRIVIGWSNFVDLGTYVTKVEITARSNFQQRIINAKFYIGDHLCGTLPADVECSRKYTFNCNVAGDYVKIVTGRNYNDQILGFSIIEVFYQHKLMMCPSSTINPAIGLRNRVYA